MTNDEEVENWSLSSFLLAVLDIDTGQCSITLNTCKKHPHTTVYIGEIKWLKNTCFITTIKSSENQKNIIYDSGNDLIKANCSIHKFSA